MKEGNAADQPPNWRTAGFAVRARRAGGRSPYWILALSRRPRLRAPATEVRSDHAEYEHGHRWLTKEAALLPRNVRSFHHWVTYRMGNNLRWRAERAIDSAQPRQRLAIDRPAWVPPRRRSLGLRKIKATGATRPERSVERREDQAEDALADAEASKTWIHLEIDRLRDELFHGDGATALLAGDCDELSVEDMRLTNAKAFLTLQYLIALSERAEDELVHLIADRVARRFGNGVSGRTVRAYLGEYVSNQSHFVLHQRGRWEREILIMAESDIKLHFVRWLRARIKKEELSVLVAQAFINDHLLPMLDDATLASYHTARDKDGKWKVSKTTAWSWMHLCGARYMEAKKGYYSDKHEDWLTVRYRDKFVGAEAELMLRQPLWRHLTPAAFERIETECKQRGVDPPEVHHRVTREREEMVDGKKRRVEEVIAIEIHVDALDSDEHWRWREGLRLGGEFSARFPGGRPSVNNKPDAGLVLPDRRLSVDAQEKRRRWSHEVRLRGRGPRLWSPNDGGRGQTRQCSPASQVRCQAGW